MVNEITTIKNYTVRFNSMIYLFDNCYLSTTNSIVEKAKQIWIGSHPKLDQDPMLNLTYDILHSYKEITDEQLEDLFNKIHEEHSNTKTVIYCDVKNFMYVYSYFFNGILEESAVKELYSFDRIKENYRLGTFATRDVEFVDLPKTLKGTDTASIFSSLLTTTRIEIAFANAMRGNEDALQFCVDRAVEMYDGSPGFWSKDAEQNLPALLTDAQFTISNLTNDAFIESSVAQFELDELVPNKIVNQIKTIFGFDYLKHYFTVMNNTPEWESLWEDSLELSKEEYVRTYLLNPNFAKTNQLLFPNLSNFDSINPIFWNNILHKNTAWLDKYKVKNGTYNQTN
jgi:hypothetical protein